MTPVFTPSQYVYRNSLTGGIQVVYPASTMFAYYYGMSSPANDLIIWRTFNNRVRSCPANYTYFQPDNILCNNVCPFYYYTNTSSSLCLPCHYSCYQCSLPSSNSSCSACSSSDNRSLANTSCPCNLGLYDNGSSLCLACNYRCLSCYNSSSSSCLSCNMAIFRTLNSTSSSCDCINNYY